MVMDLGFELREKQKLTACVTVTIRYFNFETVTKQAMDPLYLAGQGSAVEDKRALNECIQNGCFCDWSAYGFRTFFLVLNRWICILPHRKPILCVRQWTRSEDASARITFPLPLPK